MQRTIALITVPIILIVAFGLLALKATGPEESSSVGDAKTAVKPSDQERKTKDRRTSSAPASSREQPPAGQAKSEALTKKFSRLLADEIERKSQGKIRLDKEVPRAGDTAAAAGDQKPAAKSSSADRTSPPSSGSAPSAPPVEPYDPTSFTGIQTRMIGSPTDLVDLDPNQVIGRLIITGDAFDNRCLRNLRGIRILSLSIEAVNVTNAGLQHLADVKQLRELRIWAPGVNDAGLPILARIQALESLDLEGTNVSGTALNSLAALPRLRRLVLGPQLQEDALRQLQALPALVELDIRSCRQLTDASVTFLKDLSNLQVLWIPAQISDAGKREIREALPQCQIRL